MKFFKVTTEKTIIEETYIYANNEREAELKATVGPYEKKKKKEGFVKRDCYETSKEVTSVELLKPFEEND